MKGQFFLLTVFILIAAFYIGISPRISPPIAVDQIPESLDFIFDNVLNEYPRAVNLAMNTSKNTVNVLKNFSNFVKNSTDEMGLNFSIIWLFVKNESENVNITVGNFLGYDTNVTLNVSGNVKHIYVQNGVANSTLFVSPPSKFQLVLSFNTTEKNLLLEKHKVSFYGLMKMEKEGNSINGEIKA